MLKLRKLLLESSMESGTESVNEEATEEILANRTRRTRGTKHENTQERSENNSDNQPIDGKRVKGKYLLRRIQPVTNRYQSMGNHTTICFENNRLPSWFNHLFF